MKMTGVVIPTLGITAAKPLGLMVYTRGITIYVVEANGYVRVPGCAARLPHAPGIIGQARPGVWLSHRSGAGSGPGWEYIDIVPHVSRTRSGNWLPFAERSGTPFRTEPFRCVPFWRTNLAYRITHQTGWTPSRSHTPCHRHSRIKYRYHPGQNTRRAVKNHKRDRPVALKAPSR
jgi:hypothetical protein